MSARHSGYDPVPGDCYCTPAWVTEALLSVEEFPKWIWECAVGDGHIASVLTAAGYRIGGSDIKIGQNFFNQDLIDGGPYQAIVTNPPYSNGLAEKFVRHALKLTEPVKGKVAMLLPLAWDSAKGRRDLFADCPAFKAKYILTRRIRWENLEQKANGPSMNHAWYVWDWSHDGPPILGWLPLFEAAE